MLRRGRDRLLYLCADYRSARLEPPSERPGQSAAPAPQLAAQAMGYNSELCADREPGSLYPGVW